MICLRITLLGGFEALSADGQRIAVKGRKTQALLAALAMNPGDVWPRDKLCGLLWSERNIDLSRGSLRQVLSKLHMALGGLNPDPLNAERHAVSLDGGSVESDVARFINLAEDAGPAALEQAAELYRGELLDGLGVTDPAFEEWLDNERRSLSGRAQEVMSALLNHQKSSGALDKAIITARGLLAVDPLQETVHRGLMSLYVAQGDRAMALKQYQACRGVLNNELGIAPSPETEALYADIRHFDNVPQSAGRPVPTDGGWIAPLALPDKPSIAVLPFTNMSGDAEQDYFADGVTEDIITGLSRFRELFVIARNSSFTYKGQSVKVQDIGAELGVRYVVEGSVRKVSSRIRITAQLIEAASGNHLWAERYDREIEDIFAIQDDVTETVVATLAGRLGDLGVDYAKRKPTHSLTAFDYVLHARQLIYRYERESILEARELLEKAIALDPEYATAHSWLSEAYWAEWLGGWTTNADASFEQSTQAAAKALALDDTDPQVRIQMGQLCLNRRQYDEARSHFDKALSLNPNEPNGSMMYSYYSTCVGDPERAVTQINEAIRVDPLGHYGYMAGMAHYTARNYDQAISAFKIVRGEAQGGHAWLAACHAQSGDLGDARAAAVEFVARTTKAMTAMNTPPPASWRAFFAERHPYKHQEDMDHLLDGLSKAGLD